MKESVMRRILRTFPIFFLPICFLFSCQASADDVVRSRAAIVIDASTGRVLYGVNPTLRLPPASTTKLMTALVTLDHLSPSESTVISENVPAVSPAKAIFKEGERVTVETLLTAALIKSANDAAFALAETVGGTESRFVEMMNEKAAALGLADTRFINATGLPGGGQYITASDLANLLRQALGNPMIRDIVNTKVGSIHTESKGDMVLSNTNKLLWIDDSVVGGKTGYTREARNCLVFASRRGDEAVIVSLLGADTRLHLWGDAEKLSAKGFSILAGEQKPHVYSTRSAYGPYVERVAYKKRVKHTGGNAHKPHKKHWSKTRGSSPKTNTI